MSRPGQVSLKAAVVDWLHIKQLPPQALMVNSGKYKAILAAFSQWGCLAVCPLQCLDSVSTKALSFVSVGCYLVGCLIIIVTVKQHFDAILATFSK